MGVYYTNPNDKSKKNGAKKQKKRTQKKKAQGQGKRASAVLCAPVAAGRVGSAASAARISGNPYAPNGRMLIKHREYLQELTAVSGAGFAVQGQRIGPAIGNSTNYVLSFPWLYKIAQNFDCYHFSRLTFYIETEMPTSTGGSVMMALDPDVSDLIPASKQELMVYPTAVRAAPWENLRMDVPKHVLDMFGKRRYMSTVVTPVGDLKTFFIGNLILATQNISATYTGECYVEYEIELYDPVSASLNVDSAGAIVLDAAYRNAKIVGGGVVSKSAYFGSIPVVTVAPNDARPICTALTNTLTFNVLGDYLVSTYGTGTVVLFAAPAGTAAISNISGTVNATGLNTQVAWLVQVTAVGQTCVVDASASATISASVTRVAPYLNSIA